MADVPRQSPPRAAGFGELLRASLGISAVSLALVVASYLLYQLYRWFF